MGEKPQADEDLTTRGAGAGSSGGIAVEEEGVQRIAQGDPDFDTIAIGEEGVQRQRDIAMNSIRNLQARQASGGEGIAIDDEGLERAGGGGGTGGPAETNLNSSRSNIYREGAGSAPAEGEGPAEGATINTTKSNTFREAGGSAPADDEGPAEGSVKSTKSNTSD